MNNTNAERALVRHATSLEEWTSALQHVAQQLAILDGKLNRLVYALPVENGPNGDAAFENLVEAIFAAMGTRTWCIEELRPRSQMAEPAGLALASALTMLGGDLSNRSIGKLVGNWVGTARATSNGYLISRSGLTRNVVGWTVARVSN